MTKLTCIELCAGGGGQALGLSGAGFRHLALVDNDEYCCETLRTNRRGEWKAIVRHARLEDFNPIASMLSVDLVAAGLPCPPFSKAGKQLGEKDERNLFPAALKIIRTCRPKAVMIENVRGIRDPRFANFRANFEKQLHGYVSKGWHELFASDFGVPQLRPRVVFVALIEEYAPYFDWPLPSSRAPMTVGQTLLQLMSEGGWQGAQAWSEKANKIAPTIVGGSHKHGGPDLGPTRAKKAWAELMVNAHKLADAPPDPGYRGMPHLTVEMVARLQGFPKSWRFSGAKTHAYRQVGNAFPPPVAKAVGLKIRDALLKKPLCPRLEW